MAEELTDTEKLKEYLRIVVDMEKEIFIQDSTIDVMLKKSNQLGCFQQIARPGDPYTNGMEKLPLIGLELAVVMLPLFGIPITFFYIDPSISSSSIAAFGWVFSILATIFLLAKLPNAISDWLYSRSRQRDHEQAMSDYQKRVAADKQRVQAELAQKSVLEPNIQTLQAQNAESRATLQKIYDRGIIFPKYRNLVMVCSIYEYFCSGRCTTLEGHEGAYNILEMEIRLDRITTQLDRVIAQLGAIQQNQYMLYSAIQESNRRSEQLLSSVDQLVSGIQELNAQGRALNAQMGELKQTSAFTAYHAERVQKELSYMNRMDYLTGRNNDAGLYNIPPT